MYVTVNPLDRSVCMYSSLKHATTDSIKRNKNDPTHPAFELWLGNKNFNTAQFIGALHRDFGSNKLYWRK